MGENRARQKRTRGEVKCICVYEIQRLSSEEQIVHVLQNMNRM